MSYPSTGNGLSPFAALLGNLGLMSQPSPLIPNPNMQEPPSNFPSPPSNFPPAPGNGFGFGPFPPPPGNGFPPGSNFPTPPNNFPIPPSNFSPVPADVRLGFHQGQLSQAGLGGSPNFGLFPHADPGAAMGHIHQVLAHHHNALQSLLAAIHSIANTPPANRPSHPLPLQ